MSLSGKTALITGGTKGIGASIAAALSAAGANVVISYGSDASAAERVVSELGGRSKVLAVKSNAGSIPDIESLVKQAVDKFGQINILIANAGILPMKTLEQATEKDFDQVIETNVKGPFFLCQVRDGLLFFFSCRG